MLSLRTLAREHGFSHQTVARRRRSGMTLAQAVSTPLSPRAARGGETILAASRRTGIPVGTLYSRMSRKCLSLEEAIAFRGRNLKTGQKDAEV